MKPPPKQYLVIFTEKNGARVEKHPEFIELHKNDENVLLNPELPKGVSPSNWFKDGDKIGVSDNTSISNNIHSSFLDERIIRQDNINEKLKKQNKNIKIFNIILLSVIMIGLTRQILHL